MAGSGGEVVVRVGNLEKLLADREFLRSELLAVAQATVPDQEALVEDDKGPIAPGGVFDGASKQYVCGITVTAGDPEDTITPREHVELARRLLNERGWQIDPMAEERISFRSGATRGGFDVEFRRFKDERVLTLSGDTPVYRLLRDPLLPPGEGEPDEINP